MHKLILTFSFAAAIAFCQDAAQQCDNSTVRGAYGIQISGTRPSPPNGPIETVIGVVVRVFDGAGNYTQTDNVKGSISGWAAPDRQGTGTYTVNPDCSLTMTLHNPGVPFPIVERAVIVNGGAEFRTITVEPAALMITAIGTRMLPDWWFAPIFR